MKQSKTKKVKGIPAWAIISPKFKLKEVHLGTKKKAFSHAKFCASIWGGALIRKCTITYTIPSPKTKTLNQ